MQGLRQRFGDEFEALGHDERLALVTADVEEAVTNERFQGITRLHSADITQLLAALTNRRMLQPVGKGRWMKYHLPESWLDDRALDLWASSDQPVPQEEGTVQQGPSPVQHEVRLVQHDMPQDDSGQSVGLL